MLFTSFFTKNWVIIVSSVLAVIAALMFYSSIHILSNMYNIIVSVVPSCDI